MKNTENAFKWIIDLLKTNDIPFQISGGFAARLYGANRPLFDIDIDIPDDYFEKLIPSVKDYIVYGPERSQDEAWDLLLMTLEYENQRIDISGGDTIKLFNVDKKQWELCASNLKDTIELEVYGEMVPVIKKQALIDYKNIIKRPTDLEDIKMLTKHYG